MNIMYVLAHPDDAEIWCGGTILTQIKKGFNVKIVYLYATKNRRKEALLFTSRGVNIEFCRPNIVLLRKIIKRFNPNIIVTHWFKDCHHEHKKCFDLLYSMLPELLVFDGLTFSFYTCDTYNSIGFDGCKFNPNTFIDISSIYDDKKILIKNHKSQPFDYFIKMVEKQNKYWASLSSGVYVESFQKIPVQGNYYEFEL